jgi:adenine specific DNA methylase Mod
MSYRTSLPLHETEDDKPKKKKERGRDIVHYKVPGKENTYRITTRRKMKKDLKKHDRANKRMKKVKSKRVVRQSF